MTQDRLSKEYLNGVPELLILRLLADREMYGYQIVRAIQICTDRQMTFAEGAIYPVLHGLQARRLLATRRELVDGRPRIYYRLTHKGQKKLQEKIENWRRVTTAVQSLLDGGAREIPAT
jgi:PadR family transcriptional regulator PadR